MIFGGAGLPANQYISLALNGLKNFLKDRIKVARLNLKATTGRFSCLRLSSAFCF
jgi:hypothetical protein